MKNLKAALAAVAATTLFVALAITIAPTTAWGHAQLTGTVPERGAALPEGPEEVVVEFNEPVEGTFGAITVFDSTGRKIETGPAERPDGRSDALSVRLSEDLPEGAYTATYRVISADSHPVSGGFIFSVGEGAAPAMTVAELLQGEGDSGAVVDVVFAAGKVATYMSLAAIIGGLAFAFLVWLPANPRPELNPPFSRLSRRIVAWGGLGLVAAALVSLVSQGALAGGTGLTAALDLDVLGQVMDTRFGHTLGVRGAAGLILALAALRLFAPGLAGRAALTTAVVAALAASVSLALGGHAGSASPSWLTVSANLLHVVAMAAWFGGLGLLLLAVPRFSRRLEKKSDRTVLLAVLVGRFSVLAVAAVAALLVTGIAQSVVYLEEVRELWETAFGRAILVKIALLGGLIAIGFYNRQRLRPRLAEAAAGGQSPGTLGRALRTALRAEIALALGVLVASAALASYAPAASADSVFSDLETAGPVEVELVLDPPRVGPQELHVYLFDGATGRQWDQLKDVQISAEEPGQEIGPVPVELQKAGPGHYVAGGSLIAVPGEWTLALDIRVSEFDVYQATFEVRVR